MMARILGPGESVESLCNTSETPAPSIFTAKRVKVAILDSNVDFDSEVFRPYEERTKDNFKDFIEDGKKAEPDSHGTHVAALLLQMAPEAEVFVGRSFENRDCMTDAIWYALMVWKVDIISISGGFDELDNDMEEALDATHACGVCVFAATHNEGLNKQLAFPARYKTVYGTSSTDHNGGPSKRASEPPLNKTNYATLDRTSPLPGWHLSLNP